MTLHSTCRSGAAGGVGFRQDSAGCSSSGEPSDKGHADGLPLVTERLLQEEMWDAVLKSASIGLCD